MTSSTRVTRGYTRRELGRLALGSVPAAVFGRAVVGGGREAAPIDSRIRGVQIGAITYSFRALTDAHTIVKTMASMGLGEVELMSNHAEALAGAPVGPNAADALRTWRHQTTPATWAAVRRIFDGAGIDLRSLCYNMNVKTFSDADIEYGLSMAKHLGVKVMSTSTQVSMAKRVAPLADRHQIIVAYHGHANIHEPDEVSTPETFAACLSYSKYHAINLDIGHFTAAGFDALTYLREQHARITHLHLKDRRTPAHGADNVAWGDGDTPIAQVLQLISRERWDIPANIEFEYPGDPLTEVPKCLAFCRRALA
jgi:sugar phosphate isomerase/epimerase